MRQFRNIVFPALCAAVMAASVPTAAVEASAAWREARDMPEVALTECAAQMARRGYEIQGITGGREIDRYVDLRYEAARGGRTVTAVCRYDSARERVTAVKESRG
jgi:hypothetical protein